jgi:integrase
MHLPQAGMATLWDFGLCLNPFCGHGPHATQGLSLFTPHGGLPCGLVFSALNPRMALPGSRSLVSSNSLGKLWIMATVLAAVGWTTRPSVTKCMPPRQTRLPPVALQHRVGVLPPLDTGPAGKSSVSSATLLGTAETLTRASTSQAGAGASNGWVPPRGDGQQVQPYARGSKRSAILIAADPSERCSATAELKDRIFAKSNKSAMAIKLNTWIEVAHAAGFQDPFAPDPELLYTVGGALWKANYRSIDSYMGVARQEMLLQHGTIPEALTIHFRRISRAAARGRGPAKQASEIPFLRLQEVPTSEQPLCPLGPCWPQRFAVTSSWWMLREIEASNLTLSCIEFKESEVSILLPASKTDATGRGTNRTLCCTCSTTPSSLCPFHILEAQWAWASSKRGAGAASPLFPATTGESPSKKAVVDTIVAMARHLGLAEFAQSGAPRFTGHSFRVTGAMWLAASGIDVWRIQLHGRWGSSTVLRYVRLAPLASSLALEASLGRDLSTVRAAILEAKATLATTGHTPLPVQDSLVAALGPTLATPAKFLGVPQADHILGNRSVKGWSRIPNKSELLVSNIGPPQYDGKLHSLKPPRQWSGQPPTMSEWDFASGAKAWCSFDFKEAAARCEFKIWTGKHDQVEFPLCGRCFGKPEARKAVPASSSSESSED